ncbi:hypothetical protein [Dokdonella soli]
MMAALSASAAAVSRFPQVCELLDAISDGNSTVVEALRIAFGLYLKRPHDFGTEGRFENLEGVSDAQVALWSHAFALSTEAVLIARLGDLVWERRFQPRPDRAARHAIAAYLELADRWDGLEGMLCAARASELARALRDRDLTTDAYALAGRQFNRTIDDISRPGVSMGYLRLLVHAPSEFRPADLSQRIVRAKATLGATTYLYEAVLDLERLLAAGDPARLRALQVEHAQRLAEDADGTGLASLLHLQRASVVAEHLPEIRGPLLQRIRAIDLATVGFKEIRALQPVDEMAVRRTQEAFLAAPTWWEAIGRLLQRASPSGDDAANRGLARDLLGRSLLGNIATQLSVDPETNQARPVESEQQRFDQQLGEIERCAVQLDATFLVEPVLQYLPVRFTIEPAELRSALLAKNANAAASNLVADSLLHWWEGAPPMAVAMMLIPAIESLARSCVESDGGVVLDIATAEQRGGFRPLGDLIQAMQGRVDESWRRFLVCALVGEHGINLRNRLCHGLLLDASHADVAVLALVAMFLAVASPVAMQDSSDAKEAGGERNPDKH